MALSSLPIIALGKYLLDSRISMDELGWSELSVKLSGYIRKNQLQNNQTISGTHDDMNIVINKATPSHVSYCPSTDISIIKFCFTSAYFSLLNAPVIERQEILLKNIYVDGNSAIDIADTKISISDVPHAKDNRTGLISAKLTLHADTDYSAYIWLLSTAQRCIVKSPMQSAYSEDQLVWLILTPTNEHHKAAHPMISRAAGDIVTFLSLTIPSFKAKQVDYALDRLIHYYCLAFAPSPNEIKFIMASVFMEAFKFYWALNVKKISRITDGQGRIKGFERSISKKNRQVPYEFAELLTMAATSIGVTDTYTFIDERHAIFHSGKPRSDDSREGSYCLLIKPELTKLYTQMDNILLRILGYSGEISRWESPDTPALFPYPADDEPSE
ncbi:MAG: hypothetical protein QX197_17265 [Methylococcaceae bacterium]